MCGICGFITQRDIKTETLKAMNDAMIHRGPDDFGEEIISAAGVNVGLAHRRLSIVDISKHGHQPMYSFDKSIRLIFNGEIYNYRELREQLDYPFTSNSDTEVIIAAYLKWGIECLSRFNGMFAIALFDRRDDTLYLVRDRIGEKPLYYGYTDSAFVFASELKALKLFPDFKLKIDRDTLALFVKYNYIPAPYTIYKNTHKLMPGHYAVIRADKRNKPEINKYWNFLTHCKPVGRSGQEVMEETESLLTAAVRRQMAVDVPFGAFLSGGIDSSLVTALMQKVNKTPVNTYSIGFFETNYNEAVYAKNVAKHLGTNHTEYYVSPKEAMDVIPKLPHIYDEPFADSSQIPTYLVSKLAAKDLKVVLTGDGGDEMFCGYTSYSKLYSAYKKVKTFPVWFRRLLGHMLLNMPLFMIRAAASLANSSDVKELSFRRGGNVLLNADSPFNMSHASRIFGEPVVKGANPVTTIWEHPEKFDEIDDFNKLMMAVDVFQSLPDDMCVKVDRAAMNCSLENRAPLMDVSVVEYAASIPGEFMVKNGSKWILKEILKKYVPGELIERPKMGFSVPVGEWIREPMRPWAEDLLSSVKTDGYFQHDMVDALWNTHIKRKRDNTFALWGILMFQAWLKCEAK